MTMMKPLATGLLPARLALRWLRTQPIASAVPGATTLEELEENCLAGHGDATLTPEELRQVEEWRGALDQRALPPLRRLPALPDRSLDPRRHGHGRHVRPRPDDGLGGVCRVPLGS